MIQTLSSGAALTTFVFNLFLQLYHLFTDYYFFVVLLPLTARFRTVYDYRIANEYHVLAGESPRHTYFQGFVTVALNSFFASTCISILCSQPSPFLVSSSPMLITWAVYTALWFVPIRGILFLSKHTRWLTCCSFFLFECIFALTSMETALRSSYQFRTRGSPINFDKLSDDASFLPTITTISVPTMLICGYLAANGNNLLTELVNLHSSYKLSIPTAFKSPFTGSAKISTTLIIIFTLFVILFVPVEMYTQGYQPHKPFLLPTITLSTPITPSNFTPPPSPDKIEMCIQSQQRFLSFCYHDVLIGFCKEYELEKHSPTPSNQFSFLFNEMMCNLALTTIHIMGTQPCLQEDKLKPSTLQLLKDHAIHPRLSTRVLDTLYQHTESLDAYNDGDILSLFIQPSHHPQRPKDKGISPLSIASNSVDQGDTPRPLSLSHIYAVTPIEQVGQPVFARMVRNTWSSIYRRPIQYIISYLHHTTKIRALVYNFVSALVSTLPQQYTQHLSTSNGISYCFYTHPHKNDQYHSLEMLTKVIDGINTTSPLLQPAQIFQQVVSSLNITTDEKMDSTRPHVFSSPTLSNVIGKYPHSLENLSTVGRITIPTDTLFFYHLPLTQDTTTIIPITFSLFKTLILFTWFTLNMLYLITDANGFQSRRHHALETLMSTSSTE